MPNPRVALHLAILLVLVELGTSLRIGCANVEFGTKTQRAGVNETNQVTFRLFTRKNPTEFQELRINDTEALQNSNFNKSVATKIYAPGWGNDGGIAHSARDEYLKREDLNFFTVYWLNLQIDLVDIAGVLQSTKGAGDYTGAFIDFLVANGAPLSSFHIMGHSAGAHVAGATGPGVSSGRVPRITGLDPAKADVWSLTDPATCIDITDAEFVDIIHTNGGETANGEIAFDEPMGHADFYVNGGHVQTNCPVPDDVCCSHCRVVDLFTESINSQVGFVSLRCSSYEAYQNGTCDGNDQELMGDPLVVSRRARGRYYVDTNEQPPWAMG